MTALYRPTPLIASAPLSAAAGRDVELKLECLQPSGSFKNRGVGAACAAYVARGARHLVSSSGGNAGLAAAYAGRRLGVPVTVVVPETTSARARELIAAEGAAVVVHGASWSEANEHALHLAEPADAVLLHPFDDPLLWAGHATLVDELAADGPAPDAVVLSVGGGGLLAGVVEGLRRNGWADVPVIAVETAGADSLAQSLALGTVVTLPAITSIATTLGARRVADRAFDLAREHPVRSVVVDDAAALRASRRFLDDHRMVVEPACGASLAVAYDAFPELDDARRVTVVVCGGATTTAADLLASAG
ncbi:pyridoxal-phosphate dependent enzyme [Aeromicrobium camelliae]|uniref:L-serine ammonia-lyase n=1 Tax=Aeromicrobium camelliae TaxID=1538144 RepID=A0A3N6W407_9ACTN|nr:pyridoxal-phosphate dependent enzyme [Aeromicrobium camelliae]RQN02259.1 pyridoxal-phosphate dependent enzyme [Aeromicrobium camelliae]